MVSCTCCHSYGYKASFMCSRLSSLFFSLFLLFLCISRPQLCPSLSDTSWFSFVPYLQDDNFGINTCFLVLFYCILDVVHKFWFLLNEMIIIALNRAFEQLFRSVILLLSLCEFHAFLVICASFKNPPKFGNNDTSLFHFLRFGIWDICKKN